MLDSQSLSQEMYGKYRQRIDEVVNLKDQRAASKFIGKKIMLTAKIASTRREAKEIAVEAKRKFYPDGFRMRELYEIALVEDARRQKQAETEQQINRIDALFEATFDAQSPARAKRYTFVEQMDSSSYIGIPSHWFLPYKVEIGDVAFHYPNGFSGTLNYRQESPTLYTFDGRPSNPSPRKTSIDVLFEGSHIACVMDPHEGFSGIATRDGNSRAITFAEFDATVGTALQVHAKTAMGAK